MAELPLSTTGVSGMALAGDAVLVRSQ